MEDVRIYSREIRYRLSVACCGCGRKALEDRCRTLVLPHPVSMAEIQRILDGKARRATPSIPVGWSINGGRDAVSCPDC